MNMKGLIWIFALLFISQVGCSYDEGENVDSQEEDYSSPQSTVDEHNVQVTENRLAAQLFAVLEHYKQPDPVGLPNVPIPDPMKVPDMVKSLGMATLRMKNVQAHGLSQFRIKYLNADLKEMKVDAGIQLDTMTVKGSYTLSSVFSSAQGPFTVVLKNVMAKAVATLEVQNDGHLTTEQINMDLTFSDMTMDFQNLGFLGAVFQSVINSAPNLVFDALKPLMLKEADTQLREEINNNIKNLMGDRKLPNSISPLDMAIAEGRKKVRAMGYDPYHVQDYNRTVGIFSMQMVNTWITGVSSFYRIGEMIVAMENNTVSLCFQVGTQKISGATQWEVGFGIGFVSRIGHAQFIVQHIKATVNVSQALDTRQKPQINDLQIDLGNIQVHCDGAGTVDYVMEFLVNVLPNMLRYQIMDAIENPIKTRIQEKFNQIDVERAIKDNFHKFQKSGNDFSFDFKL
ncbi:uncharacterized protein LOC129907309 [Episyrphus balteatus]|uniref:uncharacterized protein LOC129907309 n=1 Tax=Episyrphus balteatus TaxID=286459 RepID=UPI002485B341|nr:uncharacterized protein LOC129907309 [Episyrphus balteatus]